MRDTIIIDIDGTLSNCDHRRHLVEGKKRDYPAFHALLHLDSVNEWCRELMRAFVSQHRFAQAFTHVPLSPEDEGDQLKRRVVLVSARPAYTRDATIGWLVNHELGDFFHEIYLLRASDEDDTPAIELKRRWIEKYGRDRILFAVDDDPRNIAQFKELGITALLAPGWKKLEEAAS